MRVFTCLAASLLLLPSPASAQGTPTGPTMPAGTTGFFDFGGRGTSTSGDAARYERYRDMGNGLFLENARLIRDRNGWIVSLNAEHVGRSDQRYQGQFVRPGRFKGWASWDQIPMLMSLTTQTLFLPPGTSLDIDDPLQLQVQQNINALPGVFDQNSRTFETSSQRDIFMTGFEFLASSETTLNAQFRHMNRDGSIPYGGSFGHSSLVEVPSPVRHSTNDLEGSAEFARDPYLFRGGFTGSWFTNEFTQLTFDSPFRLTDTSGTPGRGRLSLVPSNSFVQVNGLAEVKLPRRSRATAYVATGWLSDAGAPLMPQTINTVNLAAITPLERDAVEGEARTFATRFTFVSRPVNNVDVAVRFRSYNYDNQTPEFNLTQRVSYDNTPGAAVMSSLGAQSSTPVHSEPFGVDRTQFEADLNYRTGRGMTAGIGYVRLGEDRSHRAIEESSENAIRLTFDAVGLARFTVRTRYEHGAKRGDVTDAAARELFRIGEQPQIRHYDIASRNRDRFTVLGSVMATSALALTASVTLGYDDYLESVFGVRDNNHKIYSLGGDYVAADNVTLNTSYTYERYYTLSRSRQANPPSSPGITYERFLELNQTTGHGVQVAEAARNWSTQANDRTHTLLFSANVVRIREKFDVTLTYDFSNARGTYDYSTLPVEDRTLPEEVIVDVSQLPTPAALPPTRYILNRGTLDVIYNLNSRTGIGVSVWYEDYDVEDFTLDAEANPNLARGSTLLMGYLYRPYTATTFWARLIYRW